MGLAGGRVRLELTYNTGVDSYELGTGYNDIAVTTEDLDGKLANRQGTGHRERKAPVHGRRGWLAVSASCATRRLQDRIDRALNAKTVARALALLTVAVAGCGSGGSGSGGGDSLGNALGYLPKSAPFVVAIDTNLKGSQWQALATIAGKFSFGGQVEDQLKQAVNKQGRTSTRRSSRCSATRP